jgi:pyruvate dehydrogenase E1 component
MANLFSQIGIYSPKGQLYEPEDSSSILTYKETKSGQLLEEGISEAGAISSWSAAATSYANHNLPMMPFYIFYSMFGFQRVADLIWAAADQMPRGFLIGATAGRTTLSGEGLQHQDGQSQLYASTVPNLRSYDPCFAEELNVIFDEGMKRMMTENIDEFYYLTVYNEKYKHNIIKPENKKGIIKGGYLFKDNTNNNLNINLMGSGPILLECLKASEILKTEFNIGSRVYSITSYSELEKNCRETKRQNLFNPSNIQKNYLQEIVDNDDAVIATSDYVRSYSQMISSYIKNKFIPMGTDGFGRSDTRDNLRDFFEIDSKHIIIETLFNFFEENRISIDVLQKSLKKYGLNSNIDHPWKR